jgi:hypothetical protein
MLSRISKERCSLNRCGFWGRCIRGLVRGPFPRFIAQACGVFGVSDVFHHGTPTLNQSLAISPAAFLAAIVPPNTISMVRTSASIRLITMGTVTAHNYRIRETGALRLTGCGTTNQKTRASYATLWSASQSASN